MTNDQIEIDRMRSLEADGFFKILSVELDDKDEKANKLSLKDRYRVATRTQSQREDLVAHLGLGFGLIVLLGVWLTIVFLVAGTLVASILLAALLVVAGTGLGIMTWIGRGEDR